MTDLLNPNADTPLDDDLYLIFGIDGSVYERARKDMTLRETVRDILRGQFDGMIGWVLCVNAGESHVTDATGFIAHQVFDALDCEPSWELRNFLETHMGCDKIERMLAEIDGVETMTTG